MKRIRSASLALASIVALTIGVAAGRPHYGGTLRVDASDAATARARALPMVFETLTRIDPVRGPRPLLAESWESDAAARRWRIRLRDGLRLHDGSILAGWQVAAALRLVERQWTLNADGNIITIDLPEPSPDLAWRLANAAHAVAVRTASGSLIGTGPFRVERDADSGLTLRAFDDYRDGRPFLDSVEVQVRTPAVQVDDLESGRTDFATVAPENLRRIAPRAIWIAASKPVRLVALVFEPHRSGEDYASVRRALSASVTRDTIASVLLEGRAIPATTILPRWIPGYLPSPFMPKQPESRAAIAALPRAQRTLTLRVEAADSVARAVAERVVADAREWGFTLTVQSPAGLAPRADARIVNVRLDLMSPESMLAALLSSPGIALRDPVGRRGETDVLDAAVLVPIVHLEDFYGVSERVATWNEPVVRATGEWNFASAWLRSVRP